MTIKYRIIIDIFIIKMRNAFNALMAKNLGTHFLIKIKNPTQVGKAFDDLINGSSKFDLKKDSL